MLLLGSVIKVEVLSQVLEEHLVIVRLCIGCIETLTTEDLSLPKCNFSRHFFIQHLHYSVCLLHAWLKTEMLHSHKLCQWQDTLDKLKGSCWQVNCQHISPNVGLWAFPFILPLLWDSGQHLMECIRKCLLCMHFLRVHKLACHCCKTHKSRISYALRWLICLLEGKIA